MASLGVLVVVAIVLASSVAFGDSPSGAGPDLAARLQSRAAFRDESDAGALATARAKFPAVLDTAPLKWPALRPGEKLAGYLGDDAAVVDEGAGRRGVLGELDAAAR